ncbi:MAG: hypothetical protein A3C11_02110 [Candidatus Sungbacteria bacterium RIFCSPHIGHO2_02_FULL_49_12]|uniref:DUF2283 domain-containing protein n=1 Tax=Candidatus Sungbacteria bacterium RIFCSPHIGHO2_02_FULL_49_12 TaxID=1802271 RepID=A0A1G2KNS5_9BACT|nr:MAG: hypothetical protein A3C11_02110 [Candidatus Sungbacteria bacterium RIFCSPHIGHO2_02_FULL_49_12]
MKISYDKIADAVYIQAAKRKIAKTKKIQGNLIVDFDAGGNVRGVEILAASEWFSMGHKKPQIEIGMRKILLPT